MAVFSPKVGKDSGFSPKIRTNRKKNQRTVSHEAQL